MNQPLLRPEQIFVHAYSEHLAIALPLTILLVKLFVRWVAREPAKDLFKSVLAVPIDFVYIAMAILLASVFQRNPRFASGYRSEREMYGAGIAILVGLFFLAVVLNWSDRWIRILWQKFFVAWQQIGRLRAPHDQGVQTAVAYRFLWVIVYWVMMIPLFTAEMGLATLGLAGVLWRTQ